MEEEETDVGTFFQRNLVMMLHIDFFVVVVLFCLHPKIPRPV